MSAQGVHKITEQFEEALCKYTGAPYAVAVDNCSNAIFLALYYELHVGPRQYMGRRPTITIPKHTYPAVPCEIIHAGGQVKFYEPRWDEEWLSVGYCRGAYQLSPTPVFDSALSFTTGMYRAGEHQCLSFTGPYKHLKLGKGGAILTDDYAAYLWFKRARFSGRSECSYHVDNFDEPCQFYDIGGIAHELAPPVVGWNFYMMPEIAARGLLLMQQFYDRDGKPKHNEDLCLPYPDLSKFKLWQ